MNAGSLGVWSCISPHPLLQKKAWKPKTVRIQIHGCMHNLHEVEGALHRICDAYECSLEENEESEIEGQFSLIKSLLLGSLVGAVASREC